LYWPITPDAIATTPALGAIRVIATAERQDLAMSTSVAHRPETVRPPFRINASILVAGAIYATIAALHTIGHDWMHQLDNYPRTVFLFVWLVGLILASAMQVMHYSEVLAEMLGEPLGTLILTLSAISIETSLIVVIMLWGENDPALVRDTVFSELMIILCLMVGASLLLGGIRHRQQYYNLDAARSFLSVLIPTAIIVLVIPNYVGPTIGPTLSLGQAARVGVLTFVIYLIFLLMQSVRLKDVFAEPSEEHAAAETSGTLATTLRPWNGAVAARSGFMLLVMLLPVPLLAEALNPLVEYGVRQLDAPEALVGLLIAILVLSPEGISAIEAAWNNRLQRSVNLMLGSALSTMGLTVPVVLLISVLMGQELVLGLDSKNMVLLATTLLLSSITFGGSTTDMLKGCVHLVLFAMFFLFMLTG
jgi:Ca2+:H+ antiporter